MNRKRKRRTISAYSNVQKFEYIDDFVSFNQPSFRVGDLVEHSDDKSIGIVTDVVDMGHKSPVISVKFGDGMHEEIPVYYLSHL